MQFGRFLTNFHRLVFRFAGNGFRSSFCLAGLLCKLPCQFRQTGSELIQPFTGLLDCGRQKRDDPAQIRLHELDLLGHRLRSPVKIFHAPGHFFVNGLCVSLFVEIPQNFRRFAPRLLGSVKLMVRYSCDPTGQDAPWGGGGPPMDGSFGPVV